MSSTFQSKREVEIELWLKFFKDHFDHCGEDEIIYLDNASSKINKCYWKVVEETMTYTDHGTKRISHFLMIAIMEFSIMSIQPIKYEDNSQRLRLNAFLSLFIAKTIVQSFINAKKIFSVDYFEKNHMEFLQLVDLESFPIFSISETWRLYELLQIEKNKISFKRIF